MKKGGVMKLEKVIDLEFVKQFELINLDDKNEEFLYK